MTTLTLLHAKYNILLTPFLSPIFEYNTRRCITNEQ
jgi:hypothetical protein